MRLRSMCVAAITPWMTLTAVLAALAEGQQ